MEKLLISGLVVAGSTVFVFVALVLLYSSEIFSKITEKRVDFQIEKTASGYDVYKSDKLQYEFTKENCDSLSLETLKMIYEGD